MQRFKPPIPDEPASAGFCAGRPCQKGSAGPNQGMEENRAMRKLVMRAMSALNTRVYRLSGGKWMGRFASGAPVCLLTTKGRKSGQRRTVPLLYLEDGNDLIVVASQGGAPQHPAWYLNLEADPKGAVQIGRRRVSVVARQVSHGERDLLWPRLVTMYPHYEEYQRRTTRLIPVARLTPA
jgi:deazaflavin-dependent oxidoreductase (nitroreductase family)